MKIAYILAVMLPVASLAGVVVFEKETGLLYGSDNSTIGFQKLQPEATTFVGNTVCGAQVLNNVDWSVYDMARYTSANTDPLSTNDLVEVTVFDVQEQIAAAGRKSPELQVAENNFFALCNALFGDYQKRGFDEIQAAIDALTGVDANAAVLMSLRFLAVEFLTFFYEMPVTGLP